ncbi:Rrf2 family transcriptional regulator [Mesosutterella sp. OilRF-GAM-744-9]|uniref:Rrf2 family transcriptional regulator n=1 Tax=Mesosutterella porci TaxID=2915351 RepID=A0ABS9MSZ5_9BURK|nr:Rrf2 family transcriptional regulator [Mesosutterella sp. oilRF-744-WT-GAM-9]MCG5031735.1 Rrf2 family transcriptional regulator [Mesosutterella sp. oilRF-744-WT-GAM-9]
MRLTTKGRFAVTALVDMAMYGGKKPVSLNEIAERESISVAYLEQLFGKLRRAGLVVSIRGPGGGYLLARSPDEISAGDIVDVVEDNLDATQCGGTSDCHHSGIECLTHELWASLNQTLETVLRNATLSRLVAQCEERRKNAAEGITLVKVDPEAMRRGRWDDSRLKKRLNRKID